MSSSDLDWTYRVYQYWTLPYSIVLMRGMDSSMNFYGSAHVDGDVLVVENQVFLNMPRDWLLRKLGKEKSRVEELLGVEIDDGDGSLDAQIKLSPAEVCRRLTRRADDYQTVYYDVSSDIYRGGSEGTVSSFREAHLTTLHACKMLRPLAAMAVGHMVDVDRYRIDRMFKNRDFKMEIQPYRRRQNFANIRSERRVWTAQDMVRLDARIESLSVVRRVEVAW